MSLVNEAPGFYEQPVRRLSTCLTRCGSGSVGCRQVESDAVRAARATTGATDDKADDREQRDHTQDDHQGYRRDAEPRERRVHEVHELLRRSTQVLELVH